jgi:hypothetical protein
MIINKKTFYRRNDVFKIVHVTKMSSIEILPDDCDRRTLLHHRKLHQQGWAISSKKKQVRNNIFPEKNGIRKQSSTI